MIDSENIASTEKKEIRNGQVERGRAFLSSRLDETLATGKRFLKDDSEGVDIETIIRVLRTCIFVGTAGGLESTTLSDAVDMGAQNIPKVLEIEENIIELGPDYIKTYLGVGTHKSLELLERLANGEFIL